jgi:predicted alpha/beta-hydrolase family hydrolase
VELEASAGAAADTVTALTYHAAEPAVGATLVLGHGAGAGQQSRFMVDFAQALAGRGLDTVTFNFPYIEQRRKVPDRRPVLEACYRSVIGAARDAVPSSQHALFIGGKSMGGRMATYVAVDPVLPIAGLVLLGYPLHPPGRPTERRDAHLPDLNRPVLIVQGSKDTFGTPREFAPILPTMSPAPTLYVVDGGDHSFKVSRGGAAAQAATFAKIQDEIVAWVRGVMAARARTHRRHG